MVYDGQTRARALSRSRYDYTWKIFLNYVIIIAIVERKVHNFIQAFHRVDKLYAFRTLQKSPMQM